MAPLAWTRKRYADSGTTASDSRAREEARTYYARFADLWKNADPELQPSCVLAARSSNAQDRCIAPAVVPTTQIPTGLFPWQHVVSSSFTRRSVLPVWWAPAGTLLPHAIARLLQPVPQRQSNKPALHRRAR